MDLLGRHNDSVIKKRAKYPITGNLKITDSRFGFQRKVTMASEYSNESGANCLAIIEEIIQAAPLGAPNQGPLVTSDPPEPKTTILVKNRPLKSPNTPWTPKKPTRPLNVSLL